MARNDDSQPESFASPDEIEASEDLPGGMLGGHLNDPGSYEVTTDELEAEELDEATATDDADQLEEATSVAALARSQRPRRKAPVAPKGEATPRNRKRPVAAADRRTTPAMFVNESVEELKKVVWPTPTQVRQYYWVVLVFVLAVVAFVGVLDFAFGWVLLKLFG